MTKKTVGTHATDLLLKSPDTRDPIELQREMQKEYAENIMDCVARGKKELVPSGDFYVVVETKKERLLQNVVRNYFFYRRSCPTPTYDQTVYFYKSDDDSVQFLWVVPSKDTCELLKSNALQIAPQEKELLKFVLEFEDNTLLELAKQRNGESRTSPLLEK